MACAPLFGLLNPFPLCPHRLDGLRIGLAEDMWVAPDQLFHDPLRHDCKIEGASFPRQLAMENNLEQQVAQFLGHLVVVRSFDGVQQFVHFLDGVITERAMILFAVPRTAGRRTEPGHDGQEFVDAGPWLLWAAAHWRGGSYRITRSSR